MYAVDVYTKSGKLIKRRFTNSYAKAERIAERLEAKYPDHDVLILEPADGLWA